MLRVSIDSDEILFTGAGKQACKKEGYYNMFLLHDRVILINEIG
jgi:hypothetical protein